MVDKYNHFVCIVAGDNPEELLAPYDNSKNKSRNVVYKYKDREKLKKIYLSCRAADLEQATSAEEKDMIKNDIADIEQMSPEEFYYDYTGDYALDDNTGDAIEYKNPNGKWDSAAIGKVFALPFELLDGTRAYQAKVGDIDWGKMHGNGKEIFERAWDMVMNGEKPNTDTEKTIYENMKNRTGYFRKFGDKETYVASNTAFWGFAFLSDMTGWKELDENVDQFTWMTNFYDVFIKTLPPDTLLSIYECRRN